MSQRSCPGCGGPYRRGTSVTLVAQDGRQRPAIVCPKCTARAVVLVFEVKSYLQALDNAGANDAAEPGRGAF